MWRRESLLRSKSTLSHLNDSACRSGELAGNLYVSVTYELVIDMSRVPSVRRPATFFDVFTVTTVSITLVAIVLSIWHGSFVRIEMGAFTVIVFIWVVWAVNRILKESVQRSERT